MTVTTPLGARGDEDVLERPLEPATSGTAESWQRRSRKAKINLDKVKQTMDKQRKLRIFYRLEICLKHLVLLRDRGEHYWKEIGDFTLPRDTTQRSTIQHASSRRHKHHLKPDKTTKAEIPTNQQSVRKLHKTPNCWYK